MTWEMKFDRFVDRFVEWVDNKLGTLQAVVWVLLSAAGTVWLLTIVFPVRVGDFIVLTCWESGCIVCAMLIQTWVADEKAARVARILLRGSQ